MNVSNDVYMNELVAEMKMTMHRTPIKGIVDKWTCDLNLVQLKLDNPGSITDQMVMFQIAIEINEDYDVNVLRWVEEKNAEFMQV